MIISAKEESTIGIKRVEARDAAKHLLEYMGAYTPTITNNSPSSNVKSTKDGKTCSIYSHFSFSEYHF